MQISYISESSQALISILSSAAAAADYIIISISFSGASILWVLKSCKYVLITTLHNIAIVWQPHNLPSKIFNERDRERDGVRSAIIIIIMSILKEWHKNFSSRNSIRNLAAQIDQAQKECALQKRKDDLYSFPAYPRS